MKLRVMGAVRHQSYRGENLSTDLGLVADGSALYATSINILPFQYDMKFGDCPVIAHSLSLGPMNDSASIPVTAALKAVWNCVLMRMLHFIRKM
ncbi:hypothetical protein P4S72_12995 [Vibrio sp. PP-XX7]